MVKLASVVFMVSVSLWVWIFLIQNQEKLPWKKQEPIEQETVRTVRAPRNDPTKDGLDVLYEFSRAKLDDLVFTNHWAHEDSDGTTLDQRVQKTFALFGGWVGEDLYKGKCDIKTVIDLWTKSPEHNEVLEHEGEYIVLLMSPQKESGCYATLHKYQKL